jgi:hypothetical protein
MVSLHIRSKKEYPIEYPTDYPRFVVFTLMFDEAITLFVVATDDILDARMMLATFIAVDALGATATLLDLGAVVPAGRAWAIAPTKLVKSEADVFNTGIC